MSGVKPTGEVHPLAAIAPMLSEQELRELADSIATVGLINPIVLSKDGTLLDGRNRLAACALAGVEPTFTVHQGDPLEVVLGAEDRRHLSPGQRAMWRAMVMAEAGLRENGRWKYGSKSQDLGNSAAEALRQAGVILDWLGHLAAQVLGGEVAIDDAYRRARAEREKAKRLEELDADLAALVTHDTITMDEALARQQLPGDLRGRVNDGHISVEEARQLEKERNERVRSAVDAATQFGRAVERLEAARHSPEYPLVLSSLDGDLAKRIQKEFPHVSD